MKRIVFACMPALVGMVGGSARAAVEEHLLIPGYVVTFEGEVAYDVSRNGNGRVGSDTRAGGAPVRTVMEFALPQVSDPARIARATFSIRTSGGSRGGGLLKYALFAFGGDGVLAVGKGLGGTQLAGPFEYDIDLTSKADLSRVDVLAFVRGALAAGHTHVGLALRDINPEADFRSDQQSIFTATTNYANSRPPLLVVHVNGGPAGDAAETAAAAPAPPTVAGPAAAPEQPLTADAPADALPAATPVPAPAAAAMSGSTPLHHWSFDQPNTFDYGGIFTNSAGVTQTGAMIGPGCFRGANSGYYWSLESGPQGSAPRSLSLWFRTDAGTGDYDTLLGWGDTPVGTRYDFRFDGDKLRIEIASSGHSFTVSPGARNGQWRHALLTYAGGPLSAHKLYIDGRHVGDASGTTIPNTGSTVQIRIGSGVQQNQGGSQIARDFSGWIDDAAVFEAPLTAVDAAILHGIGRTCGLDLAKLPLFHNLWSGPPDGTLVLNGKTWLKSPGLAGSFGSAGGSAAANNAYIVLDTAGNGIRIAQPASFQQFQVSGGGVDPQLGFGKDTTALPVLNHTGGSPARWRVLWDHAATPVPLATAATNVQRQPAHFLDVIPERLRFGGGESGNSLGSDTGLYYTTGNRIYLNSQQIPYSGGAVIEQTVGAGTARYFTRNFDGLFAMVADLDDVASISLAGHDRIYSQGTITEFRATAPDGSACRAFLRARSDGTDLSTYEVILTPDLPAVTATNQPFLVQGLPASCRICYLMFARNDGLLYQHAAAEGLVARFLTALANGTPWAWAESPAGTIHSNTPTAIPLRIDGRGLAPGAWSARYVIAPEHVTVAEVPADRWRELSIIVGEPDFALPQPQLQLTALAGGRPETSTVTLTPAGTGQLVITGLASDQPWLAPAVSGAAPNRIELHFDPGQLESGTHTAEVTIDTATTRRVLAVSLTVEAQNIVRMIADPQRDRIYAIHRPDAGDPRLLVFAGDDARWFASLPLEAHPDDLSLRPDGAELLVIHRDGWLSLVDPEALLLTGRRNLTAAIPNWSTSYSASVVAGPGAVAYVAPSDYLTGNLFVVDTRSGAVLQSLNADDPRITWNLRVYDMAFHPGRRELFTWTGFTVARFAVDGDGRLSPLEYWRPNERISGFTEIYRRFRISRDGTRLLVNDREINPDRLAEHRIIYPATVEAMTPNAEVAATSTALLDPRTLQPLAQLPATSTIQQVSAGYSHLFYFDGAVKRLRALDLVALLGEQALGLRDEPAAGATVLPPAMLRWKPRAGAVGYRVWVADAAADLGAATPEPALLAATTADPWLARTTADWQSGRDYFWRVDAIDAAGGVTTGPVLRFRVSGLTVERDRLVMHSVAGLDGRIEPLAVATVDPATPWTATSNQPWLVLSQSAGTLEVRLDATTLAAGNHLAAIALRQGADVVVVQVDARIKPLQIRRVMGDPGSPFLYLHSRYDYVLQGDFLLRFNTGTLRFDRVAEIAPYSHAMVLHPADRCIYLVSSAHGASSALDRFDLDRFRLAPQPPPVDGMPATGSWSSGAALLAGPPGRVLASRGQTWLVDTATMKTIGPPVGSPADTGIYSSAFDRAGGFLFLDVMRANNQRRLVKYRLENDTFTEVAARAVPAFSYPSGGALVLSDDGSRLCRGRTLYDGDLNELTQVRPDYPYFFEFNATAFTAGGEFVTNGSALYNGRNGLEAGTLAQSSNTYLAIASDQRRLFQFGWREPTWAITDLHTLTALAAGDVTPGIADGSILFNTGLPLNWQADAKAVAYRVFLGSDASAVAAAGPGSPEFLAETSAASLAPAAPFGFDRQYFWRVDVVGFAGTRTGGVHTFRTAPLDVSPLAFTFTGPAGIPLPAQQVSLDAPAPVAWTASTATPWIRLLDTAGTTPSPLRFVFDTTGLAEGTRSGSISLTAGGRSWTYPVALSLEKTNIVIARLDAAAGMIRAISQSADDAGQATRLYPAYLVSYDAATGQPTGYVAAGQSVSDLQVDPGANRIYLAHRKTGELRVLDRTTLAQLDLFTFTPYDPNNTTAGEVGTLAAGPDGRVLLGEAGTPAELRILDGATGAVLDAWWPAPLAVRPGVQAFLPGGRFCVHAEAGGTSDPIYLLDCAGDRITRVGRAFHAASFGSTPVLPTADGSRVFIGRGVYDAGLQLLQTLPDAARAITGSGDLAVCTGGLYNVRSGLKIHNHTMSVQSIVLAEAQDKVWIFQPNIALPAGYGLSTVAALDPAANVTPVPASGALAVGGSQALAWNAEPRAFAYQVYFGSDAAAVAAATPASPEFLGTTAGTTMAAPGTLALGGEYFWRVDVTGFTGTRKGGVFSFRVAPLAVDPPALDLSYPSTLAVPEQEFALDAGAPTPWTATSNKSWLTILTPAGTTPGTLRVAINPVGLSNGTVYQAAVSITAAGRTFDVPVKFKPVYPNIAGVVADAERPLVYALAEYFLLVIDARTTQVIKVVRIGNSRPRDISIHYLENRIYITSSGDATVTAVDRDSFAVAAAHPYPPAATAIPYLGSTAPGAPGRAVLTESGDYDHDGRARLIDTATGAILSTSLFDGHPHYWDLRGGAAAFDPTGRWCYYAENNRNLLKFDTAGDRLACIAAFARTADTRSGPVVLRNTTGSRYFWGGQMVDADLNLLWDFSEVAPGNYGNGATAIDAAGDMIFGQDTLNVVRVFDANRRKYLFRLYQALNSRIAYSIPTGKLLDVSPTVISATVFEPPVEPVAAPPGLVWASGGVAPWVPAPDDGPTTMAGTYSALSNRGSLCSVHIPTAATVTFQWRIPPAADGVATLSASLDEEPVESISAAGDWQDVQIEVPDGGHFITWYCDSEADVPGGSGFVRDIAILRQGPLRPGGIAATTAPADGTTDSDGDGAPDLLEWAAGGNPTDPDMRPPITHSVVGGGFVFRFKRRLDMQGATLVAETSCDLETWQPLAFPAVRQVDIDATHETLEVLLPAADPCRFIRLRAELPSP